MAHSISLGLENAEELAPEFFRQTGSFHCGSGGGGIEVLPWATAVRMLPFRDDSSPMLEAPMKAPSGSAWAMPPDARPVTAPSRAFPCGRR